jgi:hypothetical protein
MHCAGKHQADTSNSGSDSTDSDVTFTVDARGTYEPAAGSRHSECFLGSTRPVRVAPPLWIATYARRDMVSSFQPVLVIANVRRFAPEERTGKVLPVRFA